MQLADMGADVVKVESPEGDAFRELPGFFGWNRGKRSISVDLKTPEGRAIVERLATGGDVFMENMRPGVAERLGVGWTRFAALNPRLVYCSVTAFGSTGPGAERPGFDPIFQALGGQSFWVKLTKALGLERVADDPRFGSWLLRVQNNADLLPILEARFREKPRTEWLELLAAHDIPAAPVQPLLDFFEDPAVRHHDLVYEYEHPEVGRLRLVGQPITFTETPTRDPGPPPTLGQHTDEILCELGYTDAEIAALRARRVLGGPRR